MIEHGARARWVVVLVMGTIACGSPALPPPGDPSRGAAPGRAHGTHLQIVRAMPSSERVALVERFRARNGSWTIALGGGGAPDDLDPIRGVVRRATRDGGALTPPPPTPLTEGGAIAEAAGFLGKNAEFLGFSANDVAALDLVAGPAKTRAYGAWVVHATGSTPMRGYEGFAAVTSTIDVLVYIGDDGATRHFVNLSRVHGRLSIDTSPLLGPDDKRLLTNVVGHVLFVVVDDPNRPTARLRELRRVPLGTVAEGDVRAVRLTIHVSPGPRSAYVTYGLAYAVDVVKDRHPFRFIVDADSGALLEDVEAPIVPEAAADDAD